MKRFLGVIVSVGAFVILVGAAVAQTEHGSGHDTHGTTGQKAGHEMNCPMAKAGHEMKSHMSKAEMMKGHMSKAGHDMKSHTGQTDNK